MEKFAKLRIEETDKVGCDCPECNEKAPSIGNWAIKLDGTIVHKIYGHHIRSGATRNPKLYERLEQCSWVTPKDMENFPLAVAASHAAHRQYQLRVRDPELGYMN